MTATARATARATPGCPYCVPEDDLRCVGCSLKAGRARDAARRSER